MVRKKRYFALRALPPLPRQLLFLPLLIFSRWHLLLSASYLTSLPSPLYTLSVDLQLSTRLALSVVVVPGKNFLLFSVLIAAIEEFPSSALLFGE